jgi:hypothetical protein
MEQENSMLKVQWLNTKNVLIFLSVIFLFVVLLVSILREKIVNENNDVTVVTGQGRISYQPDIAIVTLGVQVDRVFKAEEALSKLDDSMNKIIEAVKALGIPAEDIQTQSYSLSPHYDYLLGGGTSVPSGYDASQQITIKVKNINSNPNLAGSVIESANGAGANKVIGVSFDVSNLEELKQKARIEAINDARSKSGGMAKAAGIGKLGKVVSWYENIIKSPDSQNSSYGLGGSSEKTASATPQISSGTDEIIIEIGLNYRVR